jgi:hypothetical protein
MLNMTKTQGVHKVVLVSPVLAGLNPPCFDRDQSCDGEELNDAKNVNKKYIHMAGLLVG